MRVGRRFDDQPFVAVATLSTVFFPRHERPELAVFDQIQVRIRETGQSGRSHREVDRDRVGRVRVGHHEHVVTQCARSRPRYRALLALGTNQLGRVSRVGDEDLTESVGLGAPVDALVDCGHSQNAASFGVLAQNHTRPSRRTEFGALVVVQVKRRLALEACAAVRVEPHAKTRNRRVLTSWLANGEIPESHQHRVGLALLAGMAAEGLAVAQLEVLGTSAGSRFQVMAWHALEAETRVGWIHLQTFH